MGYNTSSASITKAQSTISSVVAAFNNPDGTGFGISSTGLSSDQVFKQYSVEIGVPSTESTNLSGASVTITNLYITDSSYNVLDDQAISTSGGYVKINGTGFQSGVVLYAGGTAALSTTFISATEIRAQLGAAASNTLHIYLVNPDNSVAIFLTGVVYSGTPSWITSETLPEQIASDFFSIPLVATSDSAISYAVSNGSSLPSGLTLAANGVLSGTITGLTETTIYSFSIDAIDSENQDTARTFSVTLSFGDQYFNLNSLLLTTNTNWITDSSTNKFPLTVAGDTKPTAFSPYNTSWSGYFDGTGDYLTVPSNAAFTFGTGDFTVEFWMNTTDTGAGLITPATTGSGYWALVINAGNLYWQSAYNATNLKNVSLSGYLNNAWVHIAIVRLSGTVNFYFNGIAQGAGAADATNYSGATNSLTIGYDAAGNGTYTGYLSNLRIVKGTAVYTTNFTPPTAPLTAITNTSLLTLQSNRFIDNSTNAFAITRVGDTATKSFGPFTETDLVTGSAYFDGTGDYLTVPDNVALRMESGNFTIEFWIYYNSIAGYITPFTKGYVSAGSILFQTGNGDGRLIIYLNGTAAITEATAAVANTWYHYALVRNGTTVTLYRNGAVSGTPVTSTVNFNATDQMGIGATGTVPAGGFVGQYPVTGYISNLRIVKGTAVYTTNFTPPTAPLTAVTNTSLLTLQYRTGENNNRFIDSSGLNTLLTRNGDVVQGTFSPYSPAGWSAYVDGTGDYLTVPANTAFDLSGDFTIECWVNFSALTGNHLLVDTYISGDNASFQLYYRSTGTSMTFYTVGDGVILQDPSSSTIKTNQWYHIAVTRSGTTATLFVDGVSKASATLTRDLTHGNILALGRQNTTGTNYLNGYLSNVRIVKGTAVYTEAFTPPTAPLTAITNTSLLTLQDNRFIDNSNNAFTVTKFGDTKIQAFSPFKPDVEYDPAIHGGSAYFDGTGDMISNTTAAVTNFGTGDFTVEYWAYQTSALATAFANHFGRPGSAAGIGFGTAQAGIFMYATTSTVGFTSNAAWINNQWNHVAWTRQSGQLRGFFNGRLAYSAAVTTNFTLTGTYIGASSINVNQYTGGYLSDIRVIKGHALYTENFTPRTSAAPTTANTVFKMDFTNSGIIDSTGRNLIVVAGDSKSSSVQSKFGGTSMAFDGTGDYLTMPSSTLFQFGTGEFTIEGWAYVTAAGARGIFQQGTSNFPASTSNSLALGINEATTFQIYAKNTNTNSTATYTVNTWFHFALVRSGTTTVLYINGTAVITLTADTTNYTGTFFGIGSIYGTVGTGFPGFIEDLRVTKGYARYTGDFTPPDKSLPNK